eukprot:1144867-Pelagomonas_calceolata.AAC.12
MAQVLHDRGFYVRVPHAHGYDLQGSLKPRVLQISPSFQHVLEYGPKKAALSCIVHVLRGFKAEGAVNQSKLPGL